MLDKNPSVLGSCVSLEFVEGCTVALLLLHMHSTSVDSGNEWTTLNVSAPAPLSAALIRLGLG